MDPGNFATDIQAGASFNYRMIWILIFATSMGLFLQALSSKMGLITGKDLAMACREEYGNRTPITIALWLITESAIIASDIPEIIGTAFSLQMLFGIPLWGGVLITAIDTMLFLGLQYFGVRILEAFTGALVAAISLCFVVEVGMSPISWFKSSCPDDWCSKFTEECPNDYCGMWIAGFVPRINQDGLYVAISLVGAVVMPHNLYLHSALVKSRKVEKTRAALKEASLYNWIECSIALGISCMINIFILSVAASNFYPNPANNYSTEHMHPDLDDSQRLLGNFLGSSAKYIFAIALLASGQSSTLTGTFAGQFVMQGFVDIKLPLWARNLITRSLAIVPSLIVALLAGQKGSTALIILSSAILSFQLPFALVPLMKFTSSRLKMGYFTNSKLVTALLIIVSTLVSLANSYLIYGTLFDKDEGAIWKLGSKGLRVFLIILVVIVGIVYFSFLGYLVYRPVKVQGYKEEETPLLDENGDGRRDSDDGIQLNENLLLQSEEVESEKKSSIVV